MKSKSLMFLMIGLFLVSCQKSKNNALEDLALTLRFIEKTKPKYLVSLSGNAMLSGSIKGAKVQLRTIPTSGEDTGKCNGVAGALIAEDTTTSGVSNKNDGGDFTLNFPKTQDKLGCLVVTPTPTSTVYSPFNKTTIPWKSIPKEGVESVRTVSVISLPEPTLQRNSSKKVNVNPLSNMGAGGFTQSIRQASGLNGSLLSRAKGILRGNLPLFAQASEDDMLKELKTQNNKSGELFFKNSKVKIDPTEFNFDDKTDSGYDEKLDKQYTAILGGMDKAANDAAQNRGSNKDDFFWEVFDRYLDGLTSDFAGDGYLNGQGFVDEDGNPITFETGDEFYDDFQDVFGTLSQDMKEYIQFLLYYGWDEEEYDFTWDTADATDSEFTGGDFCTAGFDYTGNCIGSFAAGNEVEEGFPAPGDYGLLTVTNNTSGTVTLGWTGATDALTPSSSLSYQVYYSTEPDLWDTEYTQYYGTPLNEFTAGLASYEVTLPSGYYFFNVLVMDGDGNTSAYTMEYGLVVGDGTGGIMGGSLDLTFGSGNGYTVFSGGTSSFANDFMIDENGNIWVTGNYILGTSNLPLWRYNGDGTLDTGFGSGGLVKYSFAPTEGRGIDMDPSGNIYIAGTSNSGSPGLGVYKYSGTSLTQIYNDIDASTSPGSILYHNNLLYISNSCKPTTCDPEDISLLVFDTSALTSSANYYNQFVDAASPHDISGGGIALYNNNIFLSGSGSADGALTEGVGILQLDSTNGGLTGFSSTGKAIYPTAATGIEKPFSFAIDSLGGIYMLSVNLDVVPPTSKLIYFDSNGILDTTFATGGVYQFDSYEVTIDIAIDFNDRPVVVGIFNNGAYNDLKVWRFNTNGTPDPSFNSVGSITHTVNGKNNTGTSVKIDLNGKILVGGLSEDLGGISRMTLWRFNP